MSSVAQVFRGVPAFKSYYKTSGEEFINKLAEIYNKDGKDKLLDEIDDIYLAHFTSFQESVYDSKKLSSERKNEIVNFFRKRMEASVSDIKKNIHGGFYALSTFFGCTVALVAQYATIARVVLIGARAVTVGFVASTLGWTILAGALGYALVEGIRWIISRYQQNQILKKMKEVQKLEPAPDEGDNDDDDIDNDRNHIQKKMEEIEIYDRRFQIESAIANVRGEENRTTIRNVNNTSTPAA